MTTRLSGGTFTPFLGGIPNLWRRALCDTDAPEPPPPPFTGGQCPSVNYAVTVGIFQGGSLVSQTTVTGIGPVLGLRIEEIDNSSPGNPDGKILQAFVRFGGSAEQSAGSGNEDTQIRITNITRPDGLPDNCGDPPPDIDPLEPEDTEIPRDITYNNNLNIPVVIPVVFVYARAQIDVDANITVPFTVNFSPTLNITGTVNVDGTVNFNFGGGTATTRPKDPRKGDCGDIAEPTEEVPVDPTDSEQPPQPDREREEVIIGALVTVTALSNERASLIVQNDNPDIYAPSLGHVQFLCRIGETSAAWTSDQPVKNRRNLIPCPWRDGAIAVRGTPQPGVTWTITPIRGYAGVPVEYVTA